MNKISLISVLPMWLFFLSECFSAPNNEPEELYVKASQLMQDVIAGAETSTSAFQSYKIAQQAILRITSDFTSSTVVAGLLSGQIRISGFTPAEFQELEQPIKRLAESEQGRLAYALALAETARHIDPSNFNGTELIDYLAINYVQSEQFDLLSPINIYLLFCIGWIRQCRLKEG